MRNIKHKIISVLIVMLMACNNLGQESSFEQDLDIELIMSSIQSVEVKPVSEFDLEGNYEILISFGDGISEKQLPQSFKLCGSGEVMVRNKNINRMVFHSITSNPEIKSKYLNELNGVKKKPGGSIGCEISFTKPGEYDSNCDEVCSAESLLGGKTIFCICIYDCSFEISW
ncbi:MAG: hypothetical protein RLN81_05145 [Balneolaceae bacterium]